MNQNNSNNFPYRYHKDMRLLSSADTLSVLISSFTES